MNFFRSILVAFSLSLLTATGASAQCGTTAPANKFCGNDSGSSGLASWKSVPTGAMSAIAGGTVIGNATAASAVPTATTAPVLGIPGTSTGQIGLAGSTSGTAILRAQAAAGSAVILLPTSAGTLAASASSPLVLNATSGLLTCPTCVTSSGGGAITGVAPVAVSAAGAVSITGLAGGVLAGSGPAFTRTPVLGVAGSAVGSLGFQNATSGTVTLQPVTGALGTMTINIPAAAGTMAVSAVAPITLSAAGAIGVTGSALTRTDDTNVTLTLGGSPSAALLAATSITVGWTGTLAPSRGGTGISSLGTGVATALGVNVGSAGAFVVNGGALGTPSSGDLTNATGLPTAGLVNNAVTNAKLAQMATYTSKCNPTSGTANAQDCNYPAINVKDFGALCNGSTDDSTAINNADAAAAAAGKALYFPAGVCMAQGLNPRRSSLEWFGDGPYLSIIKAVNPGIGFDTLAWFGERAATTVYSNVYLHDLAFDGNGTGTNAVVEIRNIQHSIFENLRIFGGSSHGFMTETSGTTINSNLLRNHYRNITSLSNAGKGFYFRGEKDAEFTGLFAHNNTGAGIHFAPTNLNSSALCETTEAYGGTLSARDNGASGIIFDEVEKYSLSSIQSSINGGYGIEYQSSITGCSSTGSNSSVVATAVLRNNALGGISATSNAYVYGAKFGNVWIRGDNSSLNAFGIRGDGVSAMQFGTVSIEAQPGTAVLFQQGTPLGGATVQSSNIQFGSLSLIGNGNASASTNHGISLLNTTSKFQVGDLVSSNLQTTGGNYELNVSSTATGIRIGSGIINAASAGNELNAAGADLVIVNRETGTRNFMFGPGPTRLTPGGTAPALSSCGTTPAISGTDVAGEVTMGTGSPTTCTITFNVAYLSVPYCTVTWQTNIASMQYTVSTSAITLTQTGTSSNKVNYTCTGKSSG